MADIELVYFSFHGRGLIPRMLFKLAGVEFKDTHIAMDEFPKIKPGITRKNFSCKL